MIVVQLACFPGQGLTVCRHDGMDCLKQSHRYVSILTLPQIVLGYDLLEIINSGPEEKLNPNRNHTTRILVSAYATWLHVQKTFDVTSPTVLAGHSLGEYHGAWSVLT